MVSLVALPLDLINDILADSAFSKTDYAKKLQNCIRDHELRIANLKKLKDDIKETKDIYKESLNEFEASLYTRTDIR